MESEAKYTFVGVTVVFLFALGVGIALWYTQAGNKQNTTPYRIYFREQSLAGLQASSVVTMRGIRVGTVRNFRILPTMAEGVVVIIDVEPATPVRTTTRAVIDRNLLTGLASIDLRAEGTHEGPLLKDVAPEENGGPDSMMVIKEGKLALSQIQDTVTDIMREVNGTLQDVRAVLSDENRKHLAGILVKTERVMANLEQQTNDLSDLPRQLDEITTAVKMLVTNTDSALATLTGEVQRLAESTRIALTTTAGSVHSTTDRLGNVADSLDQPGSLLLGPNPKQLGPGETLNKEAR